MLDFRWRHLSYIEEYIIKPSGGYATARGTGGTPAFAYLNQHINDTEAALIHPSGFPRRRHSQTSSHHHSQHPGMAHRPSPRGTAADELPEIGGRPEIAAETELGEGHASPGDLWEVRPVH